MKTPLAHKLRPSKLDDIIGQKHLVGENKIIRKMIENESLFSMILFGNPGTGKTTLAMVIANELQIPFRIFNAVVGSKRDLVAIFAEGEMTNGLVVIVEEIHRLNKDKQDLLLPHLEDGTITVIGTTTANPYFSINPAIRSRTHLFEIKPLSNTDIINALKNIMLRDEYKHIKIEENAIETIARHAGGDFRTAINILELALITGENISNENILEVSKQPVMNMDSDGDGHYDVLSGLQKSIRGSDVDAAMYYLAQLLLAGDLESITRRLTVIAYEDIGLGNPAAVARTLDAVNAAIRVGMPEAKIPLSVAVVDLALSPKSKSAYNAISEAMDYVKNNPHDTPEYIRYTPVNLDEAKKYPYDRPDLWHKIQYLPNAIRNKSFYKPQSNSTYEAALAKNYEKLNKIVRSNKLDQLKK
ncbi:MAG TPA: replication-associated recombination protein A [Erysipelotrichaceae bacterium]|nr:replication-associated recombination protein A [Erysipelotrichaceae bacterium]